MSDEQRAVVDACGTGNCVVDSVAGSGKTSTCLLLAETYPDEPNLLLTYNAKLKLETRSRVVKKGIKNLEVHSYHSFCVKFYHASAYDDVVLNRIVAENMNPLKPFRFARIILDEAQDMTPMLYRVFRKLFRDNGAARLCVLGDHKQSIYEFRHADSRFLTLAPRIFSGAWTSLQLSTTYRLTIPMADFVNTCMLKQTRLHAVKASSVLPEYVICNTYSDTMYNKVVALLEDYAPDDIFLVAPSLRSSLSPLIKLENKLVKRNVPCFVPINDDEIVDDSVLEGKIALTTIHQTKGMERKVVIVFGFDESYFKYYKRDADPYSCPNELYVAATRATERVIFVHHYTHDYLPFLCQTALKAYEVQECSRFIDARPSKIKTSLISVTGLLRHLDTLSMNCAFSKLRILPITAAKDALAIGSKVHGDTVESVSHITGTAIPAYYEYVKKGHITIVECLQGRHPNFFDMHQHMTYLKQAHRPPVRGLDLMDYPLSVQELLFAVNCWNAATNGYISQVQQIQTYDWLSHAMLEGCAQRLDRGLQTIAMDEDLDFERLWVKPVGAEITGPTHALVAKERLALHPELQGRVLFGYTDLATAEKTLEIKCTSALTMEHYLQAALYSYLQNSKFCYIFNVLTDELAEVQCDDLPGMVAILINAKYAVRSTMSDDAFLASCMAPLPVAEQIQSKCSVCRTPGHNKSTCPHKAYAKPATPNASSTVEGIIGVFDIESSGAIVNELGMVLADKCGAHMPQEFHCVTRDAVTGWAETGCPGLKRDAARSTASFHDLFTALVTFLRDHAVTFLMAHNGVASDFPGLIRAARNWGIQDPIEQLERAGIKGLIDPARFIPQHGVRELQNDGKSYKSNETLYEMAMGGPMEAHGLRPHRALDDAKAERAWMPLISSTLHSLPCATPLHDLRIYIEQYDRYKQFNKVTS